ncbi:Small-subunit processome, Utp14 [Sesbania bispinosa]|nr:Small-subunit processome, Utp14 [Sesbania bispinosa]
MNDAIIPELYPESEYNPSRDVVDGDGRVSIEDLLNPLCENPDYGKLRKRMQQIEKNAKTIYAPLPKADQVKVERKAAYEISKKMSQRAIASEFEPRTEFERKMAALVHNDKVMEAHKKDGSRLLEMNKKDRLKAESSRIQMDPEAAKEYAMKQERQRAEERLTLKHKNQNRWAKRILERGLNAQDEGTHVAIAEQLKRHAELTRKMHSMKGSSSSSDDTSDEDDEDENSAGSDQDRAYKLLEKAKEKTMKVLEEEDEVPKSGLLSYLLWRGLEKRKEAAVEEANLALQEFEDSLKKLENADGSEDPKAASTSGRRVFGMSKAPVSDVGNKVKSDNFYDASDSEDDLGTSKSGNIENGGKGAHSTSFAGDDVEDDFEKDKEGILNEENPEPEKPLSLPGWGQWTHIQQKKGLPSWMRKKHEDAQKKRAEALKKRKDAQLKNVIISEKLDKKAEKLHTKALPYPFTSKEVFEQACVCLLDLNLIQQLQLDLLTGLKS